MRFLKQWTVIIGAILVFYFLVYSIAVSVDKTHVPLSRTVRGKNIHAMYRVDYEVRSHANLQELIKKTNFIDVKETASDIVVSVLDERRKRVLYSETLRCEGNERLWGFPFFVTKTTISSTGTIGRCWGREIIISKIENLMVAKSYLPLFNNISAYNNAPVIVLVIREDATQGIAFPSFYDKETGLLLFSQGFFDSSEPLAHIVKKAVEREAKKYDSLNSYYTIYLVESDVLLTPPNYAAFVWEYMSKGVVFLLLLLIPVFVVDAVKNVIRIMDHDAH